MRINGKMDSIKIVKKHTDRKHLIMFHVYKKRNFYGYVDYYPTNTIVIDLILKYFTTSRRLLGGK